MIDWIASLSTHFTGLFSECGNQFMGLVSGTIPLVVVLLTVANAIAASIGEDRILAGCRKITNHWWARWILIPCFIRSIIPGVVGYTVGKFMDEKVKAAYCQCNMSFCHAIMGIFPHANPPEYFIYAAFAAGITSQGFNPSYFAVGAFVVGMIINIPRGFCTEKFYDLFNKALTPKEA